MPLAASKFIPRTRPAPRYLRHLLQVLVLMVLCMLFNALVLVRDLRHEADGASDPIRAFEVLEMANGQVVLCSSTDNGRTFAATQAIHVGTFSKCSSSNIFVRRIRHGREGCLSFADNASAENFLECIAGIEDVIWTSQSSPPTTIATADLPITVDII